MDHLEGRVAVVTGAASGVGRALAERFAAESMRVVLADVEEPVLDDAVAALRDAGHDALGVVTDVTDFPSVAALRDRTIAEFGAVHVVCNNAGVGAGAEGHMWEHTLNDWKWGLAVNVWGVIHGIKAFVPVMLEQGDAGHVVNTSSGNGGVSPMPATPVYALTKSGVVTLTECLYGQLRSIDARVSASVLFPGPKMLRTGLFESWRNRPANLANAEPRKTPGTTIESFEQRMADAGIDVQYTDPADVAGEVVEGILADRFWILPAGGRSEEQIAARAASMSGRTNPDYLTDVTG